MVGRPRVRLDLGDLRIPFARPLLLVRIRARHVVVVVDVVVVMRVGRVRLVGDGRVAFALGRLWLSRRGRDGLVGLLLLLLVVVVVVL